MPSLNNDNDSDGDDDMSGNESQHSASSDPKADSSEADEHDSDSSELDETECERRTAGFVKYMGMYLHNDFVRIERQFSRLCCSVVYTVVHTHQIN